MSGKDATNLGGISNEPLPPHVRKVGYLKKLKTGKKKFFVLREDTPQKSACLEYHDTEKKWKTNSLAKRTISIQECFNINRKIDPKYKFVIALYTKDDCFGLIAENEQELDFWLTALLSLQGRDGDLVPRPNFDHIWKVQVREKGLGGESRVNLGSYRLCLTSSCLNLVRMGLLADSPESYVYPLICIRRCGHTDNFFFMEVGRSSSTGPGELWMQTRHTIVAHQIHETILNAMQCSGFNEDFRHRSNSTNEKPINHRRPIGKVPPQPWNDIRGRCSTMPSRTRTNSEGCQDVRYSSKGQFSASPSHISSLRCQSITARPVSGSPPAYVSHRIGSTDSVGSTLSEDESDYHHMQYTCEAILPPTITEEAFEENPPALRATKPFPLFLNLRSTMFGRSSNSCCSDYIKMSSPLQAPEEDKTDYMNMDSSQADGYVPMAPLGAKEIPQPPEDYLDMTPASSAPKSIPSSIDEGSRYLDMTSPHHSMSSSFGSSFTQEEFHLDKVKSYFSPSADMEEYSKPIRTYSVGSHPHLRKPHLTTAAMEPIRARAYSVGSPNKSKTTIDKELGTIKPMVGTRASVKSLSAPQLPPQSRTSTSSRSDRSEDLMEIDFNQPYSQDDLAKLGQLKVTSSVCQLVTPSTTAPEPDYSSSSPLQTTDKSASSSKSIKMTDSTTTPPTPTTTTTTAMSVTKPQTATFSDYMDMTIKEEDKGGDYVNLDMNWQHKSNSQDSPHDYMNMRFAAKPASDTNPLTTSSSIPFVKELSSPSHHQTSSVTSPPYNPTSSSSSSNKSPGDKTNKGLLTITNAQQEKLSLDKDSNKPPPQQQQGNNKELHYAALDLAPVNEEVPRSPRALPPPTLGSGNPLMYAQIDFFKSEGLKTTTQRE